MNIRELSLIIEIRLMVNGSYCIAYFEDLLQCLSGEEWFAVFLQHPVHTERHIDAQINSLMDLLYTDLFTIHSNHPSLADILLQEIFKVYSHPFLFWHSVFLSTNSSPAMTRERWQNNKKFWKKTFFLNALHAYHICRRFQDVFLVLFQYGLPKEKG